MTKGLITIIIIVISGEVFLNFVKEQAIVVIFDFVSILKLNNM